MDRSGKKKYVKQVTGRHNDTELHLAAQKGDVAAVRQILDKINEQMLQTSTGAELDAKLAEIRAAVVNEVNELGETPLFTAAERGHIDVVKELLPHTTKEGITSKNKSSFSPLHIAASEGRHEIVQILLEHDPELIKTVGQSNATPLTSAATNGHLAVVNVLLSKDSSLIEISRSNGKNALHLAAGQGHVDIVKALLEKNTQLARRTDNFGCTALHVATRKGQAAIVHELLLHSGIYINVLTKAHKTALDIAAKLPEANGAEIKDCLIRHGAVTAKELNNYQDELRVTASEIQKNVNDIAEELRKKLHREGINSAINSVTVVAVLFATVAFAAILTVPGGYDDKGMAVTVRSPSFMVFLISNAVALFTSLAVVVVVVQIIVVRGEIESERQVVEVINKLMWVASVCTTVAFIASSYIVVGRHNKWAAILVTVIGGIIMAGVLGTMMYYVVKSRWVREVRKKEV